MFSELCIQAENLRNAHLAGVAITFASRNEGSMIMSSVERHPNRTCETCEAKRQLEA